MKARKTVGRKHEGDRLRRLEELNRFVRSLVRPDLTARASMKDGSWPVRKTVGRAQPR